MTMPLKRMVQRALMAVQMVLVMLKPMWMKTDKRDLLTVVRKAALALKPGRNVLLARLVEVVVTVEDVEKAEGGVIAADVVTVVDVVTVEDVETVADVVTVVDVVTVEDVAKVGDVATVGEVRRSNVDAVVDPLPRDAITESKSINSFLHDL